MAQMGHGYGSEAHLLRFLGRHRQVFDRQILNEIQATSIGWLDFRFDASATWQDAELTGLEFLDDRPARQAWARFWPTTGTQPTWDAVGPLSKPDGHEWLLVEAKANLEEIRRSTKAGPSSRAQIRDAFDTVKKRLGVRADADWLDGYYQFCFQTTVLWFLQQRGIPSRLLYVYFVGDRNPGRTCPSGPDGWREAIDDMHQHVGLPTDHLLESRMHVIFLDVANPEPGNGR